jgi:hypothetical protein
MMSEAFQTMQEASMKIATVLALLIAIPSLAAPTVSVYNLGSFENGSVVFLGADTVNIRSGPGTDKSVLDNLPVGYQVTIVKKADTVFTVDGLAAPWYLVSYTTASGSRTGYIWGGFLSLAALPVAYKEKPALILLVIKKAGPNGGIPVSALIACGGKIVAGTEFHAIGIPEGNGAFTYSVSATLHGGRAFTGITNVIEARFEYPACGYPFGTVILMYDGNRIMYGNRAVSMVEGGVFHDITKFIFPDEKGGIRNSLVSVETVEEFDERKREYRHKKTNRTVHTWDGAAFSGAR